MQNELRRLNASVPNCINCNQPTCDFFQGLCSPIQQSCDLHFQQNPLWRTIAIIYNKTVDTFTITGNPYQTKVLNQQVHFYLSLNDTNCWLEANILKACRLFCSSVNLWVNESTVMHENSKIARLTLETLCWTTFFQQKHSDESSYFCLWQTAVQRIQSGQWLIVQHASSCSGWVAPKPSRLVSCYGFALQTTCRIIIKIFDLVVAWKLCWLIPWMFLRKIYLNSSWDISMAENNSGPLNPNRGKM